MQWASGGVLFGALLALIAIVLAWTSAWLKGGAGAVATIGFMVAAIVVLEWSSSGPPETPIEFWAGSIGDLVFLCIFSYWVLGRYITATSATDLTYYSHSALVQYIDETGDKSLLARLMRIAGPLLLVITVAYGAFLGWAKYKGALE